MDNMEFQNQLISYIKSTERFIDSLTRANMNNEMKADDKKKAAYALNICTVSVSQIVDYKDLQILEQEYDAILNNLNLEVMPKDEALLNILKQLLNTITFFRIEEGDKMMIEREYQQRMKNAIWSAAPNFGLLVAGGNPLTMAVSLASQVGIGYMNYRRNKAEAGIEREQKMWRLQRNAIEQFNGLRRELFDTAWRLADKYNFPDEYRLTEKQIQQYNRILMDADYLRRYERLDAIKDKFQAYPPFWYFMGNAANLVGGSNEYSPELRAEFQKKALSCFNEYENINKFSILREDPLAASCYLEHIDLLLNDPDYDREHVLTLLDGVLNKCGGANDILELTAISYLRIGAPKEASNILKILVNEDYNKIINAQLLSGIYVHDRRRLDYELLANRVGPEFLYPMPIDENQDIAALDSEFGKHQREVLKSKYRVALSDFQAKCAIKWNKLTSVFEPNGDYSDSFFGDGQASALERLRAAKMVLKDHRKEDDYKQRMSNGEYELSILEILNDFCSGLFSLSCFENPALQSRIVKDINSCISKKRDKINELQGLMQDGNFGLEGYSESQKITFSGIVQPALKWLSLAAEKVIDNTNLNQLSALESNLRSFCLAQGIPEAEVKISSEEPATPEKQDIINRFGPEVFGHKAIVSQRNAQFLAEMTSFVNGRMTNIPYDSSSLSVYYRRDKDFDGYFYGDIFEKRSDIKSNAIMVLRDKSSKGADLVFTTQGIIAVIGNKIKYKTPYNEVKFNGKGLILYPYYEYKTSCLDLNMLNSLIRELGTKFVRSIDEKVEVITDTVTIDTLMQWFFSHSETQRRGITKLVLTPTKENLARTGFYFADSDDLDPDFCLIQLYYETNIRDVLDMRIIKFKHIDSNLQAEIKKRDGILPLE